MSVIIKGIDLPKKGENHVLVIHDDGRVERAFGTDRGTKLVLWTEAIQIPKGHGRLIDAKSLDGKAWWKDIDNAPTILESEE